MIELLQLLNGLSPHVRGNHGAEVLEEPIVRSIPHVRGNRGHRVVARASRRSIPARAGEPPLLKPALCRSKVYPRTCGGTMESGEEALTTEGLSPHVRGNRRTLCG